MNSLRFQRQKADKRNSIRDILNIPRIGYNVFSGMERLRAHKFCSTQHKDFLVPSEA